MAEFWGAADERFSAGAAMPAERRLAARMADRMGHESGLPGGESSPPHFGDMGRFGNSPPLDGGEIRRRAVVSERRGAQDLIGPESRYWVPGGYPPPYGCPPAEYAGWMDAANEAMADMPGIDHSVLWWRHMQESMRRYAPGPHEGMAPYSRHLPPSMQASRMGPPQFDGLSAEEMAARRPRGMSRLPDPDMDDDLPPRHPSEGGLPGGWSGYSRLN
jgi:hypothetical protein